MRSGRSKLCRIQTIVTGGLDEVPCQPDAEVSTLVSTLVCDRDLAEVLLAATYEGLVVPVLKGDEGVGG